MISSVSAETSFIYPTGLIDVWVGPQTPVKGIGSQTAGEGSPTPSHLLADISEQVVIDQGKAAHLLSQLQSPLGIEREKQHFKDQQGGPRPSFAGGRRDEEGVGI